MATQYLIKPGQKGRQVIDDQDSRYQGLLAQGYVPQGGSATSSTVPNSYQDQLMGLRSSLEKQYNLSGATKERDAARKALEGFQFQDLAEIFRQESDRLGLRGISDSIAQLTTEKNKQQRVLEDLPATILEGAQDVGISQGQLDRQAAQESRIPIRNISDLLNSISVLGGQYDRGLGQAQYATSLANQNQQQQFGKLESAYGMASERFGETNSLINSLFPSLAAGIRTPEQIADDEYRKAALAQDESQFARSLAQDESQFGRSLARSGSGGGLGGEDVATQYAQAILSGGASIGNVPQAARAKTQQLINDWSDDINAIKLQYGDFINSGSRTKLVSDLARQYPEFDPAFISSFLNEAIKPATGSSLFSGNFWKELFSSTR